MASLQPASHPPARVEVEKRERAPSPRSADVRARLQDAEDRLHGHVQALRRELTLRDMIVGDAPVLDHVRWHPFLAVGIAAGATALVSFVASRVFRKKPAVDEKDYAVRIMLAEFLDDAARRVGPDGDTDEAIRRALRRRAPIVVVESGAASSQERGGLSRIVLAAAKAALGFAGKAALDRLTKELTAKAETEVGSSHR